MKSRVRFDMFPNVKKHSYVIGIDGGATKTAAVLADETGHVLAESVSGPSNFQAIGTETAARAILQSITECCSRAACSPGEVRVVVAGLTGAGREPDQRRMHGALESTASGHGLKFDTMIVVSDALIALEGAFGGGPGAILISGTGSIAFGKKTDGSIVRVGGWGRLIGDQGSGYDIGQSGLVAVCKHLDGSGPDTLLTERVSSEYNLSSQEQIITKVYAGFDIASIAPLVLRAAEENDAVCRNILQRAAADLVDHVKAIVLKMESETKPLRFALLGTMLTTSNMLSILVRRAVSELASVSVQEPQASPARGAVLMALRNPTPPSIASTIRPA
ncbi:MAG: hypothetical protein HY563_08890 [Ignavibacteriales bacterium]|nr:hypothetical protein [Ignavibacteriales bacterium]